MFEIQVEKGSELEVTLYGNTGLYTTSFKVELVRIHEDNKGEITRNVFFDEDSEQRTGWIEIDEEGCWEYDPCFGADFPTTRDIRVKAEGAPGTKVLTLLIKAKKVTDLNRDITYE